ncbi:filamentous hemagglutinin family N-terminal domain protein [Rivularia sp. PCC 7116]|uniref:two-partner secretion domain-containing protein n=1 Tax=Rivularia sp. PCC 7116 TaxID=373994 RepID=UPI00029F1663|nr:filamentous hemagglutinin N-terminal domain-containing protein [Rivularia sp. PCC 7116]AFY55264.1 filamentous hemagglutinin family N-terminal domain protein [Rivularia sp. PCC 7116]
MFNIQAIFLGLSFAFAFIQVCQVNAQLIPDNTLGKENSLVNSINSLENRINGGAIRGSNLFHSFQEFNIENGKSVSFNHSASIENILTRVTGRNKSQILGKLGVIGNANLFLINPNGIVFGKDASLDIKGSFVGSTASFIDFEDGMQFSAVSPDKALLTISTPLGLGLDNPGEIRVQGDGHKLSASIFGLPFKDSGTEGLEVAPGKTIALIGGNIILEGGSLKTNSGRIELGSVASGKVDFTFTPQSMEFSYDKIETFKNIQLLKESSLQSNGFSAISNITNAGYIQLRGNTIYIKDGSMIFNSNQTNLTSKGIDINATESLEIIGSNIQESQFSSLRSQTLSDATGGDIKIDASKLVIKDGGAISGYNFGSKFGPNIKIKASDYVENIGSSAQRIFASFIVTNTFNSGNGGDIDISTNRFASLDGSTVSSSTFSSGNAGNLTIDARESIEVIGFEQANLKTSILTSLTFNSGKGGNLILNTKKLIVADSGRVDASTVGSGAAGSITINASEKVEINGSVPISSIGSRITSSADIADKLLQEVFGIPLVLTGESGAITINTNQLNILDGALLAVKNDGSGNAGKLQVKADSININNQGSISATTTTGGGGDINLNTKSLLLRGNSNISATAAAGDGGNININTQVLAALQNSDITANSEGSFGGKVTINAKGVLGTKLRESLTPKSDITATSGRGAEFNGVVDINTITFNPNFKLVELPTGLADSNQKIVAGCIANRASNFTVIGRGGLPENPSKLFVGNSPIVDLADLVPTSENQQSYIYSTSSEASINNSINNSINKNKKEIVEAKGWILDAQGNIEFVAENPEAIDHSERLQNVNCQIIRSS